MDILRRDFPQAQFTVLVGPKAAGLFEGDSQIKPIIYDKHISIAGNIALTFNLRKEKFDLLIDFRNTAFPVFLRSRIKTSPFTKVSGQLTHKKEQHLARLKSVYNFTPLETCRQRRPSGVSDTLSLTGFTQPASPDSIFIKPEDKDYIELVLGRQAPDQKLVIISPGAANEWKRWTREGFAQVCDWLVEELKVKLVLIGDGNDKLIYQAITEKMRQQALNLGGKTSLKQLAAFLQRADLVISCDSAVMHMASYYNIPVIAIFGPTDPKKYGPWSEKSFVVRDDLECSPCEKSGCSQNHECMEAIKPEQVVKVIRENFSELKPPREEIAEKVKSRGGKRILVVRTDRIGDVLLTTPVFKVLRVNFPDSFIAVMVTPITREIVEGNPYIDEVIVYDKEGKDKGLFGFLKMVGILRKRRFDIALVLYTKKRTNLLCFLSGIKERAGYYNNKFGFLLTKKIVDNRPEGKKHEAEYCLEVLKAIGIDTEDIELFMPLKPQAEEWAEEILSKYKVDRRDKLIAINPGASCPSKIWPAERFAALADRLVEKYSAKVVLLAGPTDLKIVSEILAKIKNPVINLSGHTTIGQLASFLKRCNLFISNDSGPVHIACAVGTPVVAIFGRNESGLSPKRWGPLGNKNTVLHKEVGCAECLAHNCQKGFACLLAITEEEVLVAVEKLLKNT